LLALTIAMNRMSGSFLVWGGNTVSGQPSNSSDRRQALQLEDRPHLDGPLPGAGNPPRDVDRLVEVRRVDQEEAAELFARFRERAVRHLPLPLTDANAGRRRDRVQRGGAQNLPLLVELVRQGRGLREALLALALGPGFFVGVDEEHELHRFLLENRAGHRRLYWIVVRE